MFIMATKVTEICSPSKKGKNIKQCYLSPSNYHSKRTIKVSPRTRPILGPNENLRIKVQFNPSNNFGNKTSPCATPTLARESKKEKKCLITEEKGPCSSKLSNLEISLFKTNGGNTRQLDERRLIRDDKNTSKYESHLNSDKPKTEADNLKRLGSYGNSNNPDNSMSILVCEAIWGNISISEFESLVPVAIQTIDSLFKFDKASENTAIGDADEKGSRKRKSFMSDDTEYGFPPSKRRRICA